jgi:short-subunit dehydrogenase
LLLFNNFYNLALNDFDLIFLRHGTITNVASIGGRLAFPFVSPYHATKWAIEGLSESISYELSQFNIRVTIIEPGGIKTNFIDRGTTRLWRSLISRMMLGGKSKSNHHKPNSERFRREKPDAIIR